MFLVAGDMTAQPWITAIGDLDRDAHALFSQKARLDISQALDVLSARSMASAGDS